MMCYDNFKMKRRANVPEQDWR